MKYAHLVVAVLLACFAVHNVYTHDYRHWFIFNIVMALANFYWYRVHAKWDAIQKELLEALDKHHNKGFTYEDQN